MRVIDGGITAVRGVKASGVHSGLRQEGRKDLALIVIEGEPATCVAAFTVNQVKGAHIIVSEKKLKRSCGRLQAIVCNSENANCLTGERGVRDAEMMAEFVAEKLGVEADLVIPMSTGVMGKFLEMEKIKKGIDKAFDRLSFDGGSEAAEAIITTDTHKKEIALEVELEDGSIVRVGGMAKGAGMIGPSLVIPHATMFAIIATDAKINVKTLKLYASKAIDETFNMVAVDGDMSPNDTVIVFSTGKVGSKSGEGVSESQVFQEALTKVMRGLVKMIAKDGEGATKYVEVRIEEAESKEDAKKAALAVIKSPLVKCAIFGCDPNWGRVISAIGATGIKISVKKLSLWISSKTGEEVKLLENGRPVAVIGSNQAEKARQVLYEDEIIFRAVLGTGTEKATAYGCDMSYDYVKINAEYTT